MSMKRTNVYADPKDLALIKEAAAQRGISEAEILREGIRLAALGARVWDEPLIPEDETVDLHGPVRRADIQQAVTTSVRGKGDRIKAAG
ncbi:MAG: hypothetical protein BGO26_07290 [Actinobacteria bacterium 69-20]|nr:ribbon-helix-helix protein, CopG family [Actinomycetota bacterium]OJV30164.1 MAG: hypothetical protein BGO26_07290 [Actinobacteria bacterium 69-20]